MIMNLCFSSLSMTEIYGFSSLKNLLDHYFKERHIFNQHAQTADKYLVPEIDFTLSVDLPDRPHKDLKINSSILKKF